MFEEVSEISGWVEDLLIFENDWKTVFCQYLISIYWRKNNLFNANIKETSNSACKYFFKMSLLYAILSWFSSGQNQGIY